MIVQADHDLNNLIAQYYQPRLLAHNGDNGMGKGMDGHAGKDLLVKVPCGTSQPSPFHLDGNYPSDGSGNPVTVPSSVDSWSVVSETGGGFPGATTSVYAICGS